MRVTLRDIVTIRGLHFAMVGAFVEAGQGNTHRYVLGAIAFAGIVLIGETEAKWWPYGREVMALAYRPTWRGASIFGALTNHGSAPSITTGWTFLRLYLDAVWKALVAGLLIAAGIEALLPKAWLYRLTSSTTRAKSTALGGILAISCMRCTCWGAPIMRPMLSTGTSRSAALAYWLGNPLLNPAVLVFLAFVGP